MPSRADTRVVAEHVLRAIVIVSLGFMLWQSLREPLGGGPAQIRSQVTGSALASWSRSPVAPGSIHVEIDSVPSRLERDWLEALRDRKSTRLNSSHSQISYAVFCLKKKKKKKTTLNIISTKKLK